MGHKHKLLLIGVLFMFCFRTISLIFFVNAPLFGKVDLGFISFIWMVLADPVQTCKQFLDAISISTVGCVSHVTSHYAIHDLGRV